MSISNFVSSEILERQIEEEFLNKIGKLDENDDYYEARKNSLEILKKRAWCCIFYEKIKTKKALKKYNKRHRWKQKDEEKCPKTKSIIEFDLTLSCSIKSLAVKKK